jgi:hypothetical protein
MRSFAKASDVYVGLGCFDKLPEHRGTGEEVTGLMAIGVDVDIAGPGHAAPRKGRLATDVDEARTVFDALDIAPNLLLSTGGGIQGFYVFDKVLSVAEAKRPLACTDITCARISSELGFNIDKTFDLARMLRVPGTFNRKLETPRPVTVIPTISSSFGETFTELPKFLAKLDQPPVVESRVSTPINDRHHVSRQRADDMMTPGDDFNQRHTCAEVLLGAGWIHAGTVNGRVHLTRPGKDAGTSAVVYPDGH